uniref:Putative conserved secreted protein n=1 Tax=Lutzomyia longipalpis TaxID=7200 RepID=A0A7G3AEM8_LUTLO
MIEKVFAVVLAIIAVGSLTEGLSCYKCNSNTDPGCLENPLGQTMIDCGQNVDDEGSELFRCITIRDERHFFHRVVRECGIVGRCLMEIVSLRRWGRPYSELMVLMNAAGSVSHARPEPEPLSCTECKWDLCNKY